jgi:hypothetical protein
MEKKQKHEKYEEIDDCGILLACDKGDDDMQLEYFE